MADAVPTRAPSLMAVNYLFAPVAFVTVVLRCYVRIFMTKSFSSDDAAMVVALAFFLMYASCSITGAVHGTGRHHADLEKDQIETAMEYWFFCYLTYAMSMMASKISISIFLLRIIVEKIQRWVVYLALLISIITGVAYFFVICFQCSPVSYFWDKDVEGGKCLDTAIILALGYLYSVLAIVTDLTFVILPMFLIWKLNLKRGSKLALIPLLSMGCIASMAVIARLPFLKGLQSDDFLWDTMDTALWSTVEQGLAIAAGSLATTRPLFMLIGEKLGWTKATQKGTSGYPYPRSGDVSLPYIHSKRRSTFHKLSPTVEETLNSTHGYHVSIAADRKPVANGSGDDIVVTTHHVQTDHKWNESEEWLDERSPAERATGV